MTADAEAGIRSLPENSVDCLVTSPPYWRLRDYAPDVWTGGQSDCRHRPAGRSDEGPGRWRCRDCGARREHPQTGLEPTADDYIATLRAVFAEARRVLTPRATVWVNLGDSYSTNSDGYWCTVPGQTGQPHYRPRADVPHKNLLGMPWRLAFVLQDDGWILRSAIVWCKPHSTPTRIRDRLATRHEMIFLLVAQPDHHFDCDSIRQLGGDPGVVWSILPNRARIGHPAVSPLEIPFRCVAAGCPPGGHVLDPFSGSGTTGVAARALGRRFTGIDTNPAYHAFAFQRIARAEGGTR
ncbi:site-specific DNA-methyltransferase [Amycolatopsis sp. A1MSW2902]|uniref:DNA-methyltransferase n=1 Tax=Amycolatopsis sp. A1MSW2902 TaxID=687413 RepID=UPI00307DF566